MMKDIIVTKFTLTKPSLFILVAPFQGKYT